MRETTHAEKIKQKIRVFERWIKEHQEDRERYQKSLDNLKRELIENEELIDCSMFWKGVEI